MFEARVTGRLRFVIALGCLVLGASFYVAAPPTTAWAGGSPDDPPRVMTRNIYLGADLNPVVAALSVFDPSDPATVDRLLAAGAATFTQVRATDFPARARALAREIDDWDPYLVGLQEVETWRSGPIFDPGAATEVEYDFLQILRSELAKRGLRYAVASEQQAFDAEAPVGAPYFRDVRLTDRDVILARADLPAGRFRVVGAQSANFAAASTFPTGRLPRAWASVDVQIGSRPALRFVTTHLDPLSDGIRQAQARELVNGPLATALPVILAGDLNSDPAIASGTFSRAAYDVLADAGLRGSGNTLPTCCQEADLLNPVPALTTRIDHVLTRASLGGLLSTSLVGTDPTQRVASAAAGLLWPSDQAGVVVGLN